eukprot:1164345_1
MIVRHLVQSHTVRVTRSHPIVFGTIGRPYIRHTHSLSPVTDETPRIPQVIVRQPCPARLPYHGRVVPRVLPGALRTPKWHTVKRPVEWFLVLNRTVVTILALRYPYLEASSMGSFDMDSFGQGGFQNMMDHAEFDRVEKEKEALVNKKKKKK